MLSVFTIDIIFISPQSKNVNAKINETVAFECTTNVTGYTIGFSIPDPDVVAQIYTEPLPKGGQRAFANVRVSADTDIRCGALDGFHLVDITNVVHILVRGNAIFYGIKEVLEIYKINFMYSGPILYMRVLNL